MSALEHPAPVPVRRRRRTRGQVVLALGSLIATVGLLEGALWVFDPLPPPTPERAHRFLPGWSPPRTISFDPGPLPGVTPGVRQVAFNRYGFVYPIERAQRANAAELRVAVLGGSTVECTALPAERRWPEALEQVLETAMPGREVTVLNLGLSGRDSRTHLSTMAHHVVHLDVDLVVFMLGANDLSHAGDQFEPMLTGECFFESPQLSRALGQALKQTQIGRHVDAWKAARTKAPRTTPYFAAAVRELAALPVAPPMQVTPRGLAAYGRNIVSLAGLCAAHGIAVAFATTPAMWPANPGAAERAVLWGMATDAGRVEPENFVSLLDTLNQHLVRTCAERGIACVDLAAQIPKGFACFYDMVHFNEAGARLVAETVAPVARGLVEGRR